MVLAGSRPAPDGTGIPQEYSAPAGAPARAAHRRGFRSGQLPQQALAACSGVWLFMPGTGSAVISAVPVLMKSFPAGRVGLAPPRAIEARVCTPMLAILPGYCAESAAMVPSLSNPLT